ncbi:hypothetical protein QC334_37705 [Streptomyces sp. DH18]|uniref:hypothetical protein n=1 Tax=Streptomyces sp. DH18 TaxID=3040126 RepID=UPI0024414EC7|nr:hypothetical protein [Streptomyces sp. DH18]MDG9688388.1 hypothetical protein [Streptomyces sp. DH18]
MTDWIEPCARETEPAYSSEQVELGRKLVARDDLVTGEKQRTRLEIGDLLLAVAPMDATEPTNGSNGLIRAFAADIGMTADRAREYRAVSAGCISAHRKVLVDSDVTVSYSVVREAALGFSLPKETREAENALAKADREHRRQERWEILLEMMQESGRRRVTAQEFRAAIGARPIPNSASAMTAEKIVEQLDRPDVRSAVMASVMEPTFLVEALAADPMAELKIRDSLAQVTQVTGSRQNNPPPEENDDRLVLQFRRRVNLLHGLVEMHPEQIINIADEDMLNDLEKACEGLAHWAQRLHSARACGQAGVR